LGQEFGATTGRKRQINWFNVTDIIKSIRINGVTDLVINKLDIIEQVGQFNIYEQNNLLSLQNSEDFKNHIINRISTSCPSIQKITFSKTPYDI
jgi:adenylosuccinate synthase